MTMHVIKVPDVGEGIAEVELVHWHVQPGDAVAEDQPLADVMTDKASVEIPSPVSGRVDTLGGAVGQMLAVGSVLIRIEVGAAAGQGAAPAVPPPAASPAPLAAPPAAAVPPVAAGPRAAPAAAAAAASAVVAGALPPAASPSAPASSAAPLLPTGAAPRPAASPSVRRHAADLGVDLASVRASGPAGRVTHADIEAALSASAAPSTMPTPVAASPVAAAAAAAEAVIHTPAPPAPTASSTDATQTIAVVGLRRRIAQRMQDAKRRVPHFSYVEELDVTDAEALRATLNARFAAQRGKLTLLPLLMRALVLALRDFPQINAHFDDEAGRITRYAALHLGIATQTAHGLLVPVLRDVQTLDLWAMAAGVARLAASARAGRATRDELSGSTLTLSSLGALGGIASTPIVNLPEVAIVGVNRIVERPVVRAGSVVVRQMMNLSSSFDHRVVDGADAAGFIQAVRAVVEQPALLLVD